MGASLKGMTAFVTGGSGAIGAGCALRLLQDGAAVVLMGRGHEALEAMRGRLLKDVPGGRVEFCAGDARKTDDVRQALQVAYDLQKRLDIIVATVGGGEIRPLLLHDADTFQHELDLNIKTAFLAIRYGVPLMERGGSIVCISSTAAVATTPWYGAYMTGKAGLEGLVKAAAEEFSSAGIRVNAVRPGTTFSEAMAFAFNDEAITRPILTEVPLGRLGVPEDTAEAVRYLAGPESSWVTGQSIAVDGGGELRKNPDLASGVAGLFGQDALDAVRKGKVPKDVRTAPLAMSRLTSPRP